MVVRLSLDLLFESSRESFLEDNYSSVDFADMLSPTGFEALERKKISTTGGLNSAAQISVDNLFNKLDIQCDGCDA
jgi:hypothetical protein